MLLAAGTDVRSEEKGWRTEFDAICGQTENTVDMTVADLRAALARCDRLRESIDRLEPTPRKVYQKRLQMCRNLLEYMLETKLKQGGQ
jgi:hypothetical protein